MKNTTFSKALMSLSALTCVGWISAVQAQEIGQVISRTPVYQQVAVPRQVCTQSQARSWAPLQAVPLAMPSARARGVLWPP